MNKLRRPENCGDWAVAEDVLLACRKVKEHYTRVVPTRASPEGTSCVPVTSPFVPLWRRLKTEFARAQYGICAWCGSRIRDVGHGDLDHVRPKAELTRTIGSSGKLHSDGNVRGRKLLPQGGLPGYWWLAYEFTNFAYVCYRCNSTYKKTLFPVRGQSDASNWAAPSPDESEAALLPDPFADTFDPLEHFAFDDIGWIIGKDDVGKCAIDVCGLNGAEPFEDGRLREPRRERYILATRLADDFSRAGTTDERVACARQLLKYGAWSSAHAAVFRFAVTRQLDCMWEDLEKLAESEYMEPKD